MDVEIIRSGKRKKTISAREVDGVIAHLKVPGHGYLTAVGMTDCSD